MKKNNTNIYAHEAIIEVIGERCAGYDFWISIGADTDKKWSDKYLNKLLSDDMAKNTIDVYDVPRENRVYTDEERKSLRKYATPKSHSESIVYMYPPYIQDTLLFFVKMFMIDISTIPDPRS